MNSLHIFGPALDNLEATAGTASDWTPAGLSGVVHVKTRSQQGRNDTNRVQFDDLKSSHGHSKNDTSEECLDASERARPLTVSYISRGLYQVSHSVALPPDPENL